MAETTAETLRNIVALCGPVPGHTMTDSDSDAFIVMTTDHILANARRVLRERGIDVRWAIGTTEWRGHWLDGEHGRCTASFPTEADAILAALESVQPKVETKGRYTHVLCLGEYWFADNGKRISFKDVLAILNSPHYTQSDIDEAVAETLENVASMHESEVHNLRSRIEELRKGGAK